MNLTICDLCFRWSVLEIESNENIADEQQAFAAGYLEGKLTRGDFLKDFFPLKMLFLWRFCYLLRFNLLAYSKYCWGVLQGRVK